MIVPACQAAVGLTSVCRPMSSTAIRGWREPSRRLTHRLPDWPACPAPGVGRRRYPARLAGWVLCCGLELEIRRGADPGRRAASPSRVIYTGHPTGRVWPTKPRWGCDVLFARAHPGGRRYRRLVHLWGYPRHPDAVWLGCPMALHFFYVRGVMPTRCGSTTAQKQTERSAAQAAGYTGPGHWMPTWYSLPGTDTAPFVTGHLVGLSTTLDRRHRRGYARDWPLDLRQPVPAMGGSSRPRTGRRGSQSYKREHGRLDLVYTGAISTPAVHSRGRACCTLVWD